MGALLCSLFHREDLLPQFSHSLGQPLAALHDIVIAVGEGEAEISLLRREPKTSPGNQGDLGLIQQIGGQLGGGFSQGFAVDEDVEGALGAQTAQTGNVVDGLGRHNPGGADTP